MEIVDVENLIIGAGLSGLMVGALLKRNYRIVDAALGPKFGVSAPFYLHAPIDWLPTEWREVDVHHNVWDGENFHRAPSIKHMNDYSRKITGKIINTSLKFMDGSVKKGFVPSKGSNGQVLKDLYEDVKGNITWAGKVVSISLQKREVIVQFNLPDTSSIHRFAYRYNNLISTMPLPAFIGLSGQAMPCDFRADPVYTSTWEVHHSETSDVFQIVYVTDPQKVHRASLMGNQVILESMDEMKDVNPEGTLIFELWGIRSAVHQSRGRINPGKFHPIDENIRKHIINKLTIDGNVYSLGRWACWKYARIDHVSEDAHNIIKMIKSKI